MMRLGGQTYDGVRLHVFCTRRYTEQVTFRNVVEGLKQSGRTTEGFEVVGGGFIATGPDEETVRERMDWVRYRVVFYGPTRTYHGVFAQQGLEELGLNMHQNSLAGEWEQLADGISDDLAHTFAAAGPSQHTP